METLITQDLLPRLVNHWKDFLNNEFLLYKNKCEQFFKRRIILGKNQQYDKMHADKGENAKKLLEKMMAIALKLDKYRSALQKLDVSLINQEIIEIKEEIGRLIIISGSYIIDLNVTLADMHLYLYFKEGNPEFLTQAANYNKIAFKILETNGTQFLQIRGTDKQKTLIADFIRLKNQAVEAQKILEEAHRRENIDENHEQFKQTINSALKNNDHQLLYTLLLEQENYYIKQLTSSNITKLQPIDIEIRRKILLKIKEIYFLAINTRSQLCDDLHRFSPINMIMSTMLKELKIIVDIMLNDMGFFVKNDNYYQQKIWSNNLIDIGDFCKKLLVGFPSLKSEYTAVESEMNKQLFLFKKQEERYHCEKEYDVKFSKIVAAFPADKKVKKKKKTKNAVIDFVPSADNDEGYESACNKDEIIQPCIITAQEIISPRPPQQIAPTLNLTLLLDSLKKAQEENDVLNEIKTNFSLADYHYLEASHYMKDNSQLDETIQQFELNNKYLATALQCLNKALKPSTNLMKNYAELKDIHEWATIILSKMNNILQKLLQQQATRYEALEKSRQKAKGHMGKAWFKEEAPNQDKLSERAKEYLISKNAFTKISQLKNETEKLILQPLEQKEPTTNCLDFIEVRQICRSLFKHSFFSTTNQLPRRLSVNSFFDPVERNISEYEKQGFGRF